MDTNQEPVTNEAVQEPTPAVVEHALLDLEQIGRMWASQGLRIGMGALQTSAASLTAVAGLLGTLAQSFQSDKKP